MHGLGGMPNAAPMTAGSPTGGGMPMMPMPMGAGAGGAGAGMPGGMMGRGGASPHVTAEPAQRHTADRDRLGLGRHHFGRGTLAGANRAVDPTAHHG